MNQLLKEKIRLFVLEKDSSQMIEALPDPFWQGLKSVGTELWLDTGDLAEAERNWTAEMTALTTNNTLLNNEIQKGIYDDLILQAREIVQYLPLKEQVKEIAFILNARHGLMLAQRFGGFVSVELHTDVSHDIDAIVDYGLRYYAICPMQFIVKVPYTACGLLGARRLREMGVKINFTLGFSARQNVLVAFIAKPNYLNIFLGRLGAYVKGGTLGDGSGVGERAVLSCQKWMKKLTSSNPEPTRLIAASLRNAKQLELLAGTDVYTIPPKVAADGKKELSGNFESKLNEIYPVPINDNAIGMGIEKLWEVTHKHLALGKSLDENLPQSGSELIDRVHNAGLGDMFPYLSDDDYFHIANDGKIPKHDRWANRLASGELAIDTLLNLAGLASFTQDQAQLDARIESIITQKTDA